MTTADVHLALAPFTPRVREWFTRAFAEPTPAQVQAWPAISAGAHALVSAPTGSGKTLAAFLWALDRFIAEPPPAERKERTLRLVYISPLKALGYDVERNLRAPLRGIGADVTVAVRTGDTPQRERAAMLRTPPDILITTPESLYLMLTSQARRLFAGTQWVIVDEIHAVAQTKRGAHLAVTLERLAEQAGRDVQRIGLSATQRPLEEVARYLVGPSRECAIVDAGVRKPLDLRIHVPVESMVEPDVTLDLEPLPGGSEATRRSIWPAIYPELLSLVREHRSTLVFVNNRRAAERIALRLNDLAAQQTEAQGVTGESSSEIARAHHGSLAREERVVIEDLLKSGQLPCLVATSSLELGIDMGAVDLVIQVESPKSVTRGLQRIGRAGHGVGEVSRGRIFPKFRADLLECAVVARRMREGLIETTVVPRNPLDVLAQQVVAIAASAGEEGVAVDELHALFRRTWTYADLERRQLENVLDMLDGRYPSAEFAELRSRIVWDRLAGTVRARTGARALAVANAGTIPDRGLFSVNLPDGRRVGELDEEMVYEARAGQTFLLGATTWRIEQITRDRVVVTPAPGVPGAVPFWHGEGVGRPRELGEAIGAFAREAVRGDEAGLRADYDLDERAASNLLAFLREQEAATGVVPSDRTLVAERFRDEIGDWRLCVLSPYGGRVHAAWALALSARIRDAFGLEADAIWSDDGIIVHLPDADEPPGAELVLVDPEEAEDLVVAELGGSALFGARFRENAARSLLIPRAYPGRRTPLWQQRLKAQSLLEVARRYPQFPVVLETYRECLRDVLDVPGLQDLLRKLSTREVSMIEVETQTASPFASSLLFDYVAAYMYEGDTPAAERRAVALSLDRELLRELLGQEELRDLIDPAALEQVEDDLQHRSEHLRARDADALHDVLRRVGDLTAAEAAERAEPPDQAGAWLALLEGERRAVRARLGGEERWLAAEDAGLFRDALGVVPPGGLPDVFLEDVPDALLKLLRRYARTHGPFESGWPHARYGVDPGSALAELERAGELVLGELRPMGAQREWCDPDVLRRVRRASLAVLRKEIEPVGQETLARFAPAWQGVDRFAAAGAGVDRLRDVLAPLQGLPLAPEIWEKDVLPRRLGTYSPYWLDELCAGGEVVWVGAGPVGARTGRVALYFRDDAPLLGPPPVQGGAPAGELHGLLRERLARGACFFSDLLVEYADVSAEELREALWDLAWAGEATNDAFAPLRSRSAKASSGPRRERRAGTGRFRRRARGTPPLQGRWSLAADVFAGTPGDAEARRRAWAELLLERHGVLTRELVRAEGFPGGFSALYPALSALETLGVARRGYFVEGLGGAQFALPGAVERLRALEEAPEQTLVIATADPAQPYGAGLRWPDAGVRPPSRRAGAQLVTVGGRPALSVHAGGKSLRVVGRADDAGPALEALAAAVRAGRLRRLVIDTIDGEPAVSSPLAERLLALGFRRGLHDFALAPGDA
jgi:ATP-dependent helicase Lhr and Lhr-like helicase